MSFPYPNVVLIGPVNVLDDVAKLDRRFRNGLGYLLDEVERQVDVIAGKLVRRRVDLQAAVVLEVKVTCFKSGESLISIQMPWNKVTSKIGGSIAQR